MKDRPERLDLDEEQLEALARRVERRELQQSDYAILKVALDTLAYLRTAVQMKDISMQRVLKLVFGACTEKTRHVLGADAKSKQGGQAQPKKKRPGHGRRAASAYWGAEKIAVAHEQLSAAQSCPDCDKGKLYDTHRPAVLIRLCAQPPVAGTVFELQKLRCALCGKLFGASAPAQAGNAKHDENLAPMIAVLRYGYGMPMNRLEQMQEDFGVPLPAGTQWELIREHADELPLIWEEFIRQAAMGEVIHNDDTSARILDLKKEIQAAENEEAEAGKRRTGVFTTGIISRSKERTIALFFSGRQHAGENLQKVLDERPGNLAPPIQMCDGLSRNEPASAQTLKANCNAHGRRGFVDVAGSFPDECRYVLETFEQVYKHDAHARTYEMDAEERLQYHQQESAPLMQTLKKWMEEKIDNKLVEPNSGLGQAINYMLKRWDRLTLFLHKPGVPLDNNICERILKFSIRHRNNSLFYKTENGAHIGDLFMSLIATCRFCRANPFDYLLTLRRHLDDLRKDPSLWMPWNYRATLAAFAGG